MRGARARLYYYKTSAAVGLDAKGLCKEVGFHSLDVHLDRYLLYLSHTTRVTDSSIKIITGGRRAMMCGNMLSEPTLPAIIRHDTEEFAKNAFFRP